MKRVYFAGSIRGGREDLALYPSGWAAEVEQASRRAIIMPDAFQSDEALRQKAWQDFR